ncbi:DUF2795 domain-containing protein [Streptomyces sp. 8N706]|uniref:DUF2795 domain-containing protein n=1 Tax=Streptomyces sp. 8N706 TaxID=3457416 RepID=UPI003FD5F9EF
MADINPIDLQKALKGAEYPSDRNSLVELAKRNGAGQSLVDRLAGLDQDRFEGPDDVQKAVFG